MKCMHVNFKNGNERVIKLVTTRQQYTLWRLIKHWRVVTSYHESPLLVTNRHFLPSVTSRHFLTTRQWSFSVTSRQLVTTRQWFLLSRLVKLWRVVKWSFYNDSSTCDESWTMPTMTTRQGLTSRDKCVAFSTLVSNLEINDSMIYIYVKNRIRY